ncbi:MAG: aldolase [Acidobacteria bacterium]|nr:aldolase [Acidobacteriota bacterium]
MKPNKMKQALAAKGSAVGHMISEFGTRGIARIVASAEPDFVMIDMEHTGYDTERIADLCSWFRGVDVVPMVRVPQGLYHFCARTLDVGALGIMVANVETPAQAKEIVDACKYAPLGRRGVALGGAHNDYVMPDVVGYFRYANENTTVVCMIESPTGVANVDAIAATPGVDVVWVGHFDLTQAMGIPAQFQHPDFLAAMHAVTAAAKKHGKAAGIQPGDAESARQWQAIGFNVLSWGIDYAVYRAALADGVKGLRGILAE